MFADSKSTRLIQLADSIVYWIFRRYSAQDDWGWRVIHPYFASLGSGRTGLHEVLAPETPAELAAMPTSRWPFPQPLDGAAPEGPGEVPPDPPIRIVAGAIITR
ncbi:hypothetical protein D3C81_1651470 [compost metagenome]